MSNGDLVSPYAEEPQPQTNAEPQAASAPAWFPERAMASSGGPDSGAAGVYGAVTVRAGTGRVRVVPPE